MRGISINDFTVAMETYGANRLENTTGTRYDKSVPCFEVCGVTFLHSGSFYISLRGKKVPEEIMNQAMAKVGAEHPGDGVNYWWGEVHSIKGLLILASLLEGKYSEELVDQLTNETYKKLLDNPEIKSNEEVLFEKITSPKMKQLRRLLSEYSSIVNPFGNDQLHFKDPIEYLDEVSVDVSGPDEPKNSTYLYLGSNTSSTEFQKDCEGWHYRTGVIMQRNRRSKYLHISHYYNNGKNGRLEDEIVRILYSDRATKGYRNYHPDDFDLRISLKTGYAWENYYEDLMAPATDEDLDIVISHLKATIKRIKHKIVNKMVIPA